MTPQEAQLIDDLFDRLAKLESAPRDPAAERLISDGLQRAPHAIYALVQTALVQDEALKRAGARIEELEAQTANAAPVEQRPASFLDNMREALSGRTPARGSVPSVRPPAQGSQPQNLQPEGSQAQNFQPQAGQPQPGYPQGAPPGYPGSPPFGSGGSFLGGAASTAAGVVGGSLLLDSIRSMFGHRGAGAGAGESSSPLKSNADPGAADSGLGRDLGADRIGKKGDDAGNDQRGDAESAADTDDDYNPDDSDDADDSDDVDDSDGDDFDGGDSDDDSYDA